MSVPTSHPSDEATPPEIAPLDHSLSTGTNAPSHESLPAMPPSTPETEPEATSSASSFEAHALDNDTASAADEALVAEENLEVTVPSPSPAAMKRERKRTQWQLSAGLGGAALLGIAAFITYNSRNDVSGTTTTTTSTTTTSTQTAPSTPGASDTPTAATNGEAPLASLHDLLQGNTSKTQGGKNGGRVPAATGTKVPPLPPAKKAQLDSLFQKAVAAQRAGRTEEALQAYRQILQINPQTVEVRGNLAILYLQTKRPQDALYHLQQARALQPKNPAYPWQIAQVLSELKRPREALEPLQAVVKLAPKNAQAHATLARLLSALGRGDEAIDAWKKVAALAPDKPEAALAVASLSAELKRGREAEKWGKRAYDTAQKNSSKNPGVYLIYGRVLASRGKLGQAEDVLRQGLRKFPSVVELGLVLADVRWDRGDKKGSIATWQSLLPHVPASLNKGMPRAQVHASLARAYGSLKRWPEAVAQWREVTALVPNDASGHLYLGAALLRTGDKAGSLAEMERALKLDPKRLDLRLEVARALAESGDLNAASTQYSTLRRARPDSTTLLAEHAQVLEKQKKLPEALAAWQRAGRTAPKSALPALQSARLLRVLKRDNESLTQYRRALALSPGDPNALLGAAAIEEEKGDGSSALIHWTRLAKERPEFGMAYGRAMRLAVKRGSAVETANALKAPLRKSPENRAAFSGIMRGLLDAKHPEAAESFVKEFRSRFPRANAPEWAETTLELELKKAQLNAIIERNKGAQVDRTNPSRPTGTTPSGPRGPVHRPDDSSSSTTSTANSTLTYTPGSSRDTTPTPSATEPTPSSDLTYKPGGR